MQPSKPIRKSAINIESLPKMINCVNLLMIEEIKPNAGNIKIYTSGCPKNQKRCWKSKRSPPRKGSKKQELKCLSLIIIVIQAANTGIEIISSNDVKKIDQLNNSIKLNKYNNENDDTDNIDDIKLMLPNSDDKPAICKLKNNKSIDE